MSLLSVGQLNRYVKSLLEGNESLCDLSVSGELLDFHRHFKTGHLYFTLKDDEASVKCVMFASSATKLKFEPQDGMGIILQGRASLYERGGQYQLYADQMIPDGEGSARIALQKLYEKLAGEGIFAAERKLPLPLYPERVAVLSSASGAALQDVRAVMGRRWPMAEIILHAVGVQGECAAADIGAVFNRLTAKSADVVILTRGGGSAEDLNVFNDERVIRAVAACPIPVIAAVGHEVDYTLAEMAASARASTPSAAAEMAVPDYRDVLQRIDSVEQSIQKNVHRFLDTAMMRYELAVSSPIMQQPHLFVENKEDMLRDLSDELQERITQKLRVSQESFYVQAIRLDALSPLKTLTRGFCVARKDGMTIRSALQLKRDDELSLTFADGDTACRIL